MRNLLFTIRYVGSHYHGWQIQQNAHTVQAEFQAALVKILGHCPDVKGCSRTDTGVHANMYCISLQTGSTVACERFVAALNMHLPYDIGVCGCTEVAEDFHARYSCTAKRYVYYIWNAPVRNPFYHRMALHYRRPLDEKMMDRQARDFLGTHDYTAFCSAGSKVADTVRTVTEARVAREGDVVTFTVTADGFLYHMVRIMMGTLLRITEGKIQESAIPSIIASKNRDNAGPTVGPDGLYLDHVFYGGG